MKFIIYCWIVALFMANLTEAQQEQKRERRETRIDFEDELIQGDIKKPELFYLLQKKQFNYKRLIKLRDNFLPEMRSTAEDVHRAGRRD